jgi:chemotaxis family two-component system sensor kinase Cph1
VAIINQEEIYLAGITPDKQQITGLVSWLDTRTESDYYATSRLGDDYPGARAITDTASGVFFHSLHKASKQGVIWFRGERKRTISWAGDPEKVLGVGGDTPLMVPRLSFALWKQVVSNTAIPWEKPELDAGIRLATHIQNNLFLAYMTREEKKYRLQTYQLEKVNQELS